MLCTWIWRQGVSPPLWSEEWALILRRLFPRRGKGIDTDGKTERPGDLPDSGGGEEKGSEVESEINTDSLAEGCLQRLADWV